MSGISDYAATQILTAAVQLQAVTFPTQFYLALCSSAPSANQTGATIPELTSTGNYSRVAVTFGAPSGHSDTIASAVTSLASTAAWSAGATNYAIVDSATIGAGNLWYFGALGSTLTISAANQAAQIAGGTLAVSLN